MTAGAYETTIGVETHVELATASKMFCSCAVTFGAEPNTHVCPVCLGLPGSLPVPNRRAVDLTLTLGSVLDCRLQERSVFHRKSYFYPDLPKNYQISQYDLPFCVDGALEVEVDGEVRRVGIVRVHLEEDTGKILHAGGGGRIRAGAGALIDFNRSGIPLVEVVSAPDLRSPEEARAYAIELRGILLALGVSDARLEEGSVRFDANVSLRPAGAEELGTKVEIKNMNSLRSLQRALSYEVERQGALLAGGEPVVQETRHWDEEAEVTRTGRAKEEAFDYRYFPEPDLVPVEVSEEWRREIAARRPRLPAERRAELTALGLDPQTARTLADSPELADLVQEAVAAGGDAGTVANWLSGEVTARLRRTGEVVGETALTGERLASLEAMVRSGELSATAAKEVLGGVMEGEGEPQEVAARRDLIQVSDLETLEPQVEAVLAAHPEELERLRSGEQRLMGFFIGEVMKATGGKADPRAVAALVGRRARA